MENRSVGEMLFVLVVAFALYNMGYMFSSQLQHFALYPYINPEGFAEYMQHNNRFAILPAVVPGFASFFLALLLVWRRPSFVPTWYVFGAIALNLVVIASTFIWQKNCMESWPNKASMPPKFSFLS
jgi:hypothetical protein